MIGVFWLILGVVVLLGSFFIKETPCVPQMRSIVTNVIVGFILFIIGLLSFLKGKSAKSSPSDIKDSGVERVWVLILKTPAWPVQKFDSAIFAASTPNFPGRSRSTDRTAAGLLWHCGAMNCSNLSAKMHPALWSMANGGQSQIFNIHAVNVTVCLVTEIPGKKS
jgi:hypothetical protein